MAELVDDIAFGTAKGPTLFGPLLLVISAASINALVEGPPDPMISPVCSLIMSLSSRPESSIACCMAI